MKSPKNCQLQKKFEKGGGGGGQSTLELNSAAYSHYNHRHVEDGSKLAEIGGWEGEGAEKERDSLTKEKKFDDLLDSFISNYSILK